MKTIIEHKISKIQAKRAILKYLNKKPSAYVSEVSEKFGIPIETAFEAAQELMKEKKVREAHGIVQ